MAEDWTHPSIDRPPAFSVGNGRVLKGRVVIAWLIPARGALNVVAPGGRLLGIADSKAHAMLIAMRDNETQQESNHD